MNLLGLTRDAMQAYFAGFGEKAFRGTQVFQWIHQQGVDRFEGMTSLARSLRDVLPQVAEIAVPEIASEQQASDGTVKWLLRLGDGNGIETVFIPEVDRGTLCISSQAGCALNCTFCATAAQGYNRNLRADEIVAQVWLAIRRLKELEVGERPVTNVVLMGMGEPLLNLEAVVPAITILLDDLAYGLSRRRVTVSTSGVVPAMDTLRVQLPVSLAVSLHAPDDALRDELVPINRKYPIRELLAACRRFVGTETRRRVTFEYVMLEGVNDSPAQARALARLLRDVPAKVNLIPFNPFPGTAYRASSPARIDSFRDILLAADMVTITRRTRGHDIAAACGQLAGDVHDRTRRSQRRIPIHGA